MLRASALSSFVLSISIFSLTACGSSTVSTGVAESRLADQPCQSNADCGELELCNTEAAGACGAVGVCTPRGASLDCVNTVATVCGCDGQSYNNSCLAHKAGASVASQGACAVSCFSQSDCADSQYCKTPMGSCGGQGVCSNRPSVVIATCVQSATVFCGCDGTTYANLCMPAINGISIDHAGPCGCNFSDANIDGDTLAEQPWSDASQAYFYAFTGNGGYPNNSGTFTATYSPSCRRATPACAIATTQKSGTFATDGSTLTLTYDNGDSASFNAQTDCNNAYQLSGFDFNQSLTLSLTSIINY